MKPLLFRTTIVNNTILVELPNEFIGENVEIKITPLILLRDEKHEIYLKKLYDEIMEKSIPAVDITDETPNWQEKK